MQHTLKFFGRIHILLLIAALLALTACSGMKPRVSPTPPVDATKKEEPKLPKIVNLNDVEEAYRNGYYPLAERLAEEYTSRSGLDAQQLGRGWRVLALSAAHNKRPRQAVTALDRWRHSLSGADSSAEWCNAWYDTMAQLPFSDASKRAEAIIKTEESEEARPALLIREAKLFLFERPFIQGNGRQSIPGLVDMYENAERVADKRYLEQRTWKLLHGAGRYPLARLMAYTTDENEGKYPFALIRLESSRRMFWDAKTKDQALENVAFTRDGSQISDRSIFSKWNDPDYSIFAKLRVRNGAIALVLPLTGQYGNLAEKITRGAEAVRNGFEQHGQALRIYVIDSDQPNWLLELSRLPRSVKVVGGPMRMEEYNAVKTMGFAGGRFFFTFLPRMGEDTEQDEGYRAWRFFPSREDQVRAMLDYTQKLGMTDYSIFAPDQGEYAQSMFDLFYYQAIERDLYITRTGYYPARQYQLWVKNVSDFLGYSKEAEKEKLPPPPLGFQAMFLPDNWSNASRLISHVFYTMDNKILFIGTNLWEHGLASQQRLATRNYRLTIFPGSWDMQSMTPSGQIVRASAAKSGKYSADFWYSLGYDFALAAASLDLPADAKADDVNAALTSLPALPWSGASVKWDKDGFAHQQLFVLTPAENGFVVASPERIKERLKSSTDEAPAEDAPVELKPEEQLPPPEVTAAPQ